jgi:protein SCO1/2
MIRLLVLLLALASPAVAAEDLASFAFEQRPGAMLPRGARFLDEAGRSVTLQGSDTRPIILALGYFNCPNLCGVVRDDLFNALAHSGLRTPADYDLVALSIDPDERPADATRAKADDLTRYPTPGAATGWHFLTGRSADVAAVEQAVGFRAKFDPALKQFLHPAGLVILTPAGAVSSYLLGVGYEPGDLRAGVARAASGEIGQVASPILLLCFHYDAATGRYTLAIMKILRLAAGLTVVTLLGALLLAHRSKGRS